MSKNNLVVIIVTNNNDNYLFLMLFLKLYYIKLVNHTIFIECLHYFKFRQNTLLDFLRWRLFFNDIYRKQHQFIHYWQCWIIISTTETSLIQGSFITVLKRNIEFIINSLKNNPFTLDYLCCCYIVLMT